MSDEIVEMQQNRTESTIAIAVPSKKPLAKRFFKNWLLFDTLPWINRKELANSSMSTASETFRQLCWPKLHQNVEPHQIQILTFYPAYYELGNLRPLAYIILPPLAIVPIASIPPPEYITGIKQISLDFVNDQIMDFFKSIAHLVQIFNVHFQINKKWIKKQHASTQILLECLAEKIYLIRCVNLNEFDQLVPGIVDFAQYIWFDFIMNWLAKPSKSGKQKLLHIIIRKESAKMATFINRIKEEFFNSNKPSIFSIGFYSTELEEFILENVRTNEILTLYRKTPRDLVDEKIIDYFISRYPKGEEHWKEDGEKEIEQFPNPTSTIISI